MLHISSPFYSPVSVTRPEVVAVSGVVHGMMGLAMSGSLGGLVSDMMVWLALVTWGSLVSGIEGKVVLVMVVKLTLVLVGSLAPVVVGWVSAGSRLLWRVALVERLMGRVALFSRVVAVS